MYKLFLNIIKKNIYDKLSDTLANKFTILIHKYYKDLFRIFNIKYNKNNNINTYYEENDKDNLCKNMEDEDDSDNDENLEFDFDENKPMEKEIIENFINCILYYTIDEKNLNEIDHTELKITKEYESIENTLIDQFNDILQYYIKENNPNLYLFEIIEKITKCDSNKSNNVIRNEDSLFVIRRTKKRLMQKAYKLLLNKSLEILGKSFISHIKTNHNNEKYISLSDIEIENNNEYKCQITELSPQKRERVTQSVMNEINSLKFFIKDNNIQVLDKEGKIREIEKLIDNFFNYDAIQEVLLVKKMIWFYYRELAIYEENNEKIEKNVKL